MFNYNLKTDVSIDEVYKIFDRYGTQKFIPGTSYEISRERDGYNIGNLGKGAVYYKVRKKGNELTFNPNSMAVCMITLYGGIFCVLSFILAKGILKLILAYDEKILMSFCILLLITAFFGLCAIMPILGFRAIGKTIDSIVDTSYCDMSKIANSNLVVFENNRNKPLMNNSTVTVRRDNTGYKVGYFGSIPYYYNVVCAGDRIEYRKGTGSVIKTIFSILVGIVMILVDFKLIGGVINKEYESNVMGLLIYNFGVLIGILCLSLPIFRKKAIMKFLDTIEK